MVTLQILVLPFLVRVRVAQRENEGGCSRERPPFLGLNSMRNDFKFIELDETVSTNTFLASYEAADPAAVTVVTAEYQTAGRGQTGNSWESERGKNLLFSILVQPSSLPVSHVFLLSEAIALSIRDVIAYVLRSASGLSPQPSALSPQPITVKWPNDIYVGDSKIAGILIENTFSGKYVQRSIIGCGVNVNQTAFKFPSLSTQPSALIPQPSSFSPQPSASPQAPTPISLRQLLGRDTNRGDILNHILEAFGQRYASLTSSHISHPSSFIPQPSALSPHPSSLHTDYLSNLYRRTGFHPYRDAHGLFDAEIIDVEPSGHLLLRDAEGTVRRYAFKEVEYVKNKNFV